MCDEEFNQVGFVGVIEVCKLDLAIDKLAKFMESDFSLLKCVCILTNIAFIVRQFSTQVLYHFLQRLIFPALLVC